MKKHVWYLCTLVAAALNGSYALAQETADTSKGTVLRIKAEGGVEVTPDVMSVEIAVVTTGATAAAALDQNNLLAGRIIQAVKVSNIPVASMRTSNLDVDATIANDEDAGDDDRNSLQPPPRVTGFVASNTLTIELMQVSSAGRLISLMFEAGANEIRGPIFSLRNDRPAQRQAERLAIQAAQTEAQNYAEALGMKIVRPLRVSDGDFRYGDDNVIVVTGSRIRPTPIEPGKITYTATVSVEYLLEPS